MLIIDDLTSIYPSFEAVILTVTLESLIREGRPEDILTLEDLICFVWSFHSNADFEHARRFYETYPDRINEKAGDEIDAEIDAALRNWYGDEYDEYLIHIRQLQEARLRKMRLL